MLIRDNRNILLAGVLALLLLGQACFFGLTGGGADADQTLLWSHRVVGYTDTARQVLLDLYCETCETHQVSREQSLAGLRALQKLHAAHAQIYEILRAGLDPQQGQFTLTAENRAKVESLALSISDSTRALPDVIGAPGARWAAITAPLNEAVRQLVNGLTRAKTAKRGGAIQFNVSRAQIQQFAEQYSAVSQLRGEIAVWLP